MDKEMVTSYYAPLRPYVNKYARKLGRFLYDWVPDVLVILISTWIILQIWELCFWS